MVRKRIKKPEPAPEAINKSAHPLKRRRPIRAFSKKEDLLRVKGDVIRDKAGRIWIHRLTAEDESTANSIIYHLERQGKECKKLQNGSVFEIFVRKE
jgi:hypothetical protein